MKTQATIDNLLDGDELVAALNSLGIHFVAGAGNLRVPTHAFSPSQLLAGLASQPDARLRLAITALLLHRPDFAGAMPEAVARSAEPARTILKFYYTAAVFLQRKYTDRLRNVLGPTEGLPDLFSAELGIAASHNAEFCLKQLAERHRAWSRLDVNWLGTYEHAADRVIKRLERESQWAKSASLKS